MHRRKFIHVLIISGIFLFGCGAPPSQNSNTSPPVASIRVGYIPIVDCLPLYVAQDKGIFAKHGLTAELTPLQGGPRVIEALSAGSIDVGYANLVSTILANSKGIGILAIAGGPIEADGRQAHALLIPKKSPINNPQELAGKTIAVNALRNIEHVALVQYLEKNGVNTNDIKYVETPFPQMEGLLQGGQVDAAMVVEPFISVGLTHDSVRVLGHPYSDVRPRNAVANYVVTSAWSEKNREVSNRFRQALSEANEFIRNNDGEARQILAKYTQILPEVLPKVVIPEFVDMFTRDDLQAWIDELVEQQVLEKRVSPESLFAAQ